MAFLHFPNLAIRGISACVPSLIEENKDVYAQRFGEGYNDFVKTTGVERARKVLCGGGAPLIFALRQQKN